MPDVRGSTSRALGGDPRATATAKPCEQADAGARRAMPRPTEREPRHGSPRTPPRTRRSAARRSTRGCTFETFVVGRSNTLAHAAAKQVAAARRGDPVMFNPLYIHAGVGLGKTHLLQAIAWAGNAQSDRKVLYLTAEKFMYGFVSALRDADRARLQGHRCAASTCW